MAPAPPPIDQLVAQLLAIYATEPPRRRAQVDQLTEQLRSSLARLGLPATPHTTRALFLGMVMGLTTAGIDPRQPRATLAHDLLVAAAQLTGPRVDPRGLDDQPGGSS